MHPHFKPAALAAAIFVTCPAQAAEPALETIVVTATRFDASDLAIPANVSVISADDIQRSPAANLPDLLAMRAGVDARSLYGNKAADAMIDLRGFGENANLRTLVMVDGRRLESLQMSAINWNSIPLGSIERIEIIRGSSNVIHGDQATGGVINIITRRGLESAASAALTAGSFGERGLQLYASRSDTPVRYAFTLDTSESDEYRHNNHHHGTSATGRLARNLASGEAFIDLGWSDSFFQLPGSLTQAQFDHDPRAAETTDSWFRRENSYVRPGAKWQIGEHLEAAIELNVEESRSRSWLSNFPSYRDVRTQQLALTPRLRWSHGLGGWHSATVVGVDLSDTTLDQDRFNSPTSNKTNTISLARRGTGFYVHNTTQPTDSLALALGARHQRYTQRTTDSAGIPAVEATAAKMAGEVGITWRPLNNWKFFTKAATTFRYPVVDELTTFGGLASPPPRPEQGEEINVGGEWRSRSTSVQVTFYDLRMTDEIAFNNATSKNENLQKTQHRGIEIDARWQLDRQWLLNASLTDKVARFSEGANSGKTIPLVPQQRWNAGVSWLGDRLGTHSLSASHVGRRYFGGDEANAFAQLPAYTTFDWQSLWRVGAWEISGKVLNLTDRKYAPSGFNFGFGTSYYVANPRSAYLTAKYNF